MGEVLTSTRTPGADTEAPRILRDRRRRPGKPWPGLPLHLLRADRGDRDGEYLTLWIAGTRANRGATLADDDTSPFSKDVLEEVSDTSTYLNAGSCLTAEGAAAPVFEGLD